MTVRVQGFLSKDDCLIETSVGQYPDLPSCPGRDLNKKHYDSFGDHSEAVEKK